jgi:transaldolase
MRPHNLKTKIFLDGGDPGETRGLLKLLGFLDGQTTNPTLISKNPEARKRLEQGKKFSAEEIYQFYKKVVGEISTLIPDGSISIEVYADRSTPAEQMLKKSREMFSWIPNAHIKFPTTGEGLTAAGQAVKEGMRVNLTLCFTQEQAAAVYAATSGGKKGDIFVSPFVGRLDDRGENGMSLISNILKMYKKGDGHVLLLTASVRTFDHFMYALHLGSDIITAPYAILKEWGEKGLPLPENDYVYNSGKLKAIPYKDIGLSKKWQEYDISHDLTARGMEKFSSDWNALIG